MIENTVIKTLNSIWPMLTIFLVILISVRLCYLFFIVYILILFELVTNRDLGGSGINLIPFKEILRYDLKSELFKYNVIGNLVMFLPFGYVVSDYIHANKISHIFILTAIASLTIELVQLQIGRAFDIDDVLLNIAGGICGFFLFIGLNAIKKHLPGFFHKDIFYNIICIIIILIIAYLTIQSKGLGWLS